MLGIALLYFIWKYYSELAFEYHKSRWAYALLGIVSYYAGTFIGGIVLALVGMLLDSNFLDTTQDLVVNLIAMPFGLLAVWGLYKLLQRRWSKAPAIIDNGALDSEFITPDNFQNKP